MICLVCGIFAGLGTIVTEEFPDPLQLVGLLGNTAVLFVLLYYICRAYWLFKKSGGIKGCEDDKGMRPGDYAKLEEWNK